MTRNGWEVRKKGLPKRVWEAEGDGRLEEAGWGKCRSGENVEAGKTRVHRRQVGGWTGMEG